MRISRFWWIVLAAFAIACVTSYVWHWSAGIRVSHHSVRLETQRGEFAVSVWLGSEDYRMDAPMFFAHDADPRTALSDGSPRRRLGISWMHRIRSGLRGTRTVAVIAPWWHCLLGLLLLSQLHRFAGAALRAFRGVLPGAGGQEDGRLVQRVGSPDPVR